MTQTFVLLLISPFVLPALGLAFAMRSPREQVSPLRRLSAEHTWTDGRWWMVAPWITLLALSVIAPALRPDSTASVVVWYGLPAVAFVVSYLRCFDLERLVPHSPDRAFARRFNRFLVGNSVLAASSTSAFLVATADFLGPSALVLIGIVPGTIAVAALVALYLCAEPPPAHAVTAPGGDGDEPSLRRSGWRALLAAFSDRVFGSKRLMLGLYAAGYVLGDGDFNPAAAYAAGPWYLVATTMSLAAHGAICAAWISRERRKRPRAAWFVLAMAVLAALTLARALSSTAWAVLQALGAS